MRAQNRWRDVPQELLVKIVEFLDNQLDVRRVRAVCSSWRAAIVISMPPLPIPLPIKSLENPVDEYKMYRFDPIQENYPNSEEGKKSLLFQVRNGRDPVLITPPPSPNNFSASINLLEYQVSEISKVYKFKNPTDLIRKLAINEAGHAVALWRGRFNTMGFLVLRSGIKIWGKKGDYSDIIAYKEKFYAVQRDGNTIVIDPLSNEHTQIPSPAPAADDDGRKTYLVQCLGHLLLVFIDSHKLMEYVILYKLDQEEERWVPMQGGLRDQALFLDKFCSFSISASGFTPDFCKANHIYYNHGRGIFNLKDGTQRWDSRRTLWWLPLLRLGRWESWDD